MNVIRSTIEGVYYPAVFFPCILFNRFFCKSCSFNCGIEESFPFGGGHITLYHFKIIYAIKFASALAAFKCGKIGVRDGISGLNEVISFLKEKGCSPENVREVEGKAVRRKESRIYVCYGI